MSDVDYTLGIHDVVSVGVALVLLLVYLGSFIYTSASCLSLLTVKVFW